MIQDFFLIFSAFRHCLPDFYSLQIFFLQLWEIQPNQLNAYFIESFLYQLGLEGIPIVDDLRQYMYPINNHVVQKSGFEVGNHGKSQKRLQIVQDFHILGFESLFFLKTPLKESRKSVSCFIGLILIIVDFEIVSREFLSPLDLSGAQALYIHELSKVVIAR